MIRFSVRKRLVGPNGPFDLDLDESVAPGECLALFGPSGSGKTTLLRILCGLETPDQGRVEVNGEVWYDAHAKTSVPARRRRVGMVFQDYALFPNMTIRQNLVFAARAREDRARVDGLLSFTGLESLADRRPRTLSGGQRQRVALARALVSRPDLLLLDEPLSALDPAMRRDLQDLLVRVRTEFGMPTILVSHDIQEVLRTCDTVLRMAHGRRTARGSPLEVFGSGGVSTKFRLVCEVLDIAPAGPAAVATLLHGQDLLRVVLSTEEASGLAVGDRVAAGAKAFSPMVWKLEQDGRTV
ncbi:MAG TPA: ATP-binding cassette domain-containing protein [Fibrobacteria bacterium]|nr:ATP-binding cassette domain-containing protein [Fibrobacteria bacterium]